MSRQYDMVVMGSGQNTLDAAAYLAKAENKVAVPERHGHIGERWPVNPLARCPCGLRFPSRLPAQRAHTSIPIKRLDTTAMDLII